VLTKAGCLARRKRLWEAVPDSVEWLLIADPRHVLYLSNFWIPPHSFSFGERAVLLLQREQGATLLADNFATRSAITEPVYDRVVEPIWYTHKKSVVNRDHALFTALREVGEKLYGSSGAVEAEWLPLGAFEQLGFDHEAHSVNQEEGDSSDIVDLGTQIRIQRRQKDEDEIAVLQECMRACEAGHATAREFVNAGVSEFDVYREVHASALQAAGRPCIVYGDFRAVNAAEPKAGGLPTDYVLQDGDLFILDYSVVLEGYRSDFTNTIAAGNPSDAQEKLFAVLQAGMQAGERALKADVSAAEVYKQSSEPLKAAGYETGIPHHAGHGLGLAHPEPPILVPESQDTLLAGDVVTLEPGLYIEGVGGMRIEHNYLITPQGFERLSQHTIAL